jgi:hypothetical protein
MVNGHPGQPGRLVMSLVDKELICVRGHAQIQFQRIMDSIVLEIIYKVLNAQKRAVNVIV